MVDRGDHADPVRVLRDGRARSDDRRFATRQSGGRGNPGLGRDCHDDSQLEQTRDIDRQIRESEVFGNYVYDTVIPWDVTVSEAPSHGESIFEYAPRSRGARAYAELSMEVLEYV